jgi:hypothetical protein
LVDIGIVSGGTDKSVPPYNYLEIDSSAQE